MASRRSLSPGNMTANSKMECHKFGSYIAGWCEVSEWTRRVSWRHEKQRSRQRLNTNFTFWLARTTKFSRPKIAPVHDPSRINFSQLDYYFW